MKKIFSSILMMLCAITVMAQNDYVATLQHGESVSYYYGTGAFVSAYNAAAEGDVITLSSGTFTGCSVEKGITVRGVGIDAENQTTTINTEVKIYSPSAESVTTFEGITFTNYVRPYADGTKAPEAGRIIFIKNRVTSAYRFEMLNTNATVASTPKIDIIACIFDYAVHFAESYTNISVYNSYIGGGTTRAINTKKSNIKDASFNNCIISCYTYYSSSGFDCNAASFVNCVFKYIGSSPCYTRLPSNVTVMNCIADNSDVFNNIPNYGQKGNRVVSTAALNAMFKSGAFPTTWTKGTTFEITDEAAATYLGVDDTQVGMHGGLYPYNTTVGYPTVTTFNVAGKTTNTGDLNIEVKVNNEE